MKQAFVALLFLLACSSHAAQARADGQWSSRLGMGGGVLIDRGSTPNDGVFELHVATDLLFGGARPNVVRVGPMLDLRTDDFSTIEAAMAASLSLPLFQGFPVIVSAGVGYASRRYNDDGAYALGRMSFGYRPYNYFNAYSYMLGVYVDTRVDFAREGVVQIMGGIEIDLEFVIGIPVMFVTQWIRGGDPDEPEE